MLVRFLAVVCVLEILSPLARAHSQQPSEYALKAEFIERFTRFIDWPRERATTDAPFVIGIIGDDPFGAHLQRLARSRSIKDRQIVIRAIDEMEQIGECELLFIARSEQGHLGEILQLTRGKPILTVGDTDGFAAEGVMINFYLDGGKIRFEVNESAAEASGLVIESKLLKLARLVEDDRR